MEQSARGHPGTTERALSYLPLGRSRYNFDTNPAAKGLLNTFTVTTVYARQIQVSRGEGVLPLRVIGETSSRIRDPTACADTISY
jgi:hypothetical protein